MATHRTIYSMTTSDTIGVDPRIRLHDSADGPFAVLELAGRHSTLNFGIHIDAEGLATLRSRIDAFLGSEGGRRLAEFERGGAPRREATAEHEPAAV